MAFKIHIGQCLDCPPATKSLIVTKKGRCAKHTYLFNQAKKSRPKSDKSYSVLDKTEKKKVFSTLKKGIKPTGEFALFTKIWEEREHVSQLSGRPIPYFNIQSFAHILPKSGYKDWRLNPDNIWLLLPVEHRQQHDGTLPSELKKKFKEKQLEMKQIYYDLRKRK